MRRFLLGFLIVSILFMSCDQPADPDPDPDPDPSGYSIGDIGPSGIGIVFYTTDNGVHGLEAAPSTWYAVDGDPLAVWSNLDTRVGVGAQGTAIGTGFDNSEAIVANEASTDIAAFLCREYRGGGLDDWFLPSRDELDEMNTPRATIGGFEAFQYWSSTEDGSQPDFTAWFQQFDAESDPSNGGWKHDWLANNRGGIPDFTGNHVRPIRAF
jgi:hypothetical protein